MLAAAFPFVVSEALLAEYRTVLVRPRLRKLHGLTVAQVEALLTDVAQHALVLPPVAGPAGARTWRQLLRQLHAAQGRPAARHRRQAIDPRHAEPRRFALCSWHASALNRLLSLMSQ